jgi:NAD(P)-dependent dehydrogenase (short-subunit alcohol dehydrogenase family)
MSDLSLTERLAGKRTLVTGAGRGIGRSIVERCVAEGARVVLVDLDAGESEAAAAELGAEAGIGADVTDSAAVASAVSAAAERLGGLDAVVNNAGIPVAGAVHEVAEEVWDRGLAVDLKSVYLVSSAAWPLLREADGGVIVNTGSIAGMWGTNGQAAYAAAKAGVIMLTKCMALDGANDGIRVNCVSPGFIRTPMLETFLDSQPEGTGAALAARTPLGRLGQPLDIAEGFVYLLSDEARWVTGTNLVVDGGVTSGIWG